MTRFPLLAAVAAVAVVIASYLALGGLSYEPTPVADPCEQREWRDTGGLQAVAEQIVLAALDGAACELGVSREDLVLAVRDEESLDAFADEHGITRADAERAVEDGIDRAFRDADEADALPDPLLSLLRRTAEAAPPWLVLETLDELLDLFP